MKEDLFVKNVSKIKIARVELISTLAIYDALGGIRTPGRRGTGNHRSIQLSYERILLSVRKIIRETAENFNCLFIVK